MLIETDPLHRLMEDVRSMAPERQRIVLQLFTASVRAMQRDMPGPGDVVAVRVRNARCGPSERSACKRRILDAIADGDALPLIARRERVSLRWVQMIRKAASEAL